MAYVNKFLILPNLDALMRHQGDDHMHNPEQNSSPDAMALASQVALFGLFDRLVARGILERQDIAAVATAGVGSLTRIGIDSTASSEAVRILNELAADFLA
jgi:hypothetical protein